MRFTLLTAAAALAAGFALPAVAAPRHAAKHPEHEAAGPTELGKFGNWIAARYERGGETVCYAFTRAKSDQAGSHATPPLLTVTERASSRDEVALTTSAPYPKNASVTLQVGRTGLDFYTSGTDAFARDGHAAVAALRHGGEAIVRGSGERGAHGTATFSLQGFAPAYDTIVKACPAH